MITRVVRFNVVGALGIGVRTAALALFAGRLGMHYLVATALAVEISLLHNFVWHLRWTWPDPAPGGGRSRVFLRCVAFHAGNGLVSMLGSLALMPLLVAGLGMHYLAANVVAIGCTGAVNFLLGERLVFRAD
jgi:putative flippase GtrA